MNLPARTVTIKTWYTLTRNPNEMKETVMADERLETQGHRHKVRIEKIYAGKPRIFLVQDCRRCEEIRKGREEKERAAQLTRRMHPDNWINSKLQAMTRAGWKVARSKNGTFYDITSPAGHNIRISTQINKDDRRKLKEWLGRHGEMNSD